MRFFLFLFAFALCGIALRMCAAFSVIITILMKKKEFFCVYGIAYVE